MEKRFAWSFFHPTGDENNVFLGGKKKKRSIAFPPNSVSEKRWRSSSGTAEGKCKKKNLGMKQGIQGKGRMLWQRWEKGEKICMEITRKSTDEEDAKRKSI